MKIVTVKGGIGNQLWQYCFGELLKSITDEEVKYDFSFFGGNSIEDLRDTRKFPAILNFDVDMPIATVSEIAKFVSPKFRGSYRLFHKCSCFSSVLKMVFNVSEYLEKDTVANVDVVKKYNYFDGFFQVASNVDRIFQKIRTQMVPKNELSNQTIRFINQVQQEKSVFVGVRRGDYLKFPEIFGTCSMDYYDCGLRYIQDRVGDIKVYVFSDDIDWVKKNMNFHKWDVIFRNNEDIVSDFEELMIMANCKHAVIANSTFNWWGARLNYCDGKIVIAPKIWFADGRKEEIVPSYWIRMDNDGSIS